MKPRSERTERTNDPQPLAPGAFRADGSHDDDAMLGQRGPVDSFIRALVRDRRRGRLTPGQASNAINATSYSGAFPSVAQWATLEVWSCAWTGSAAEEAVKREGRGVDGHWCGERFSAGAERDCGNAAHRQQAARGGAQ